eukprot:TRINITY_DN2559_c0_g1_i5.p1 TRINITY_DN2559_c0_g1~~TRINITY_DN2559_c0_g1_i5.p1  ORF type:complete len:197 (+),score=33.70 TRINITY_DN2559_c0_g1_i5:100-690(+)
MNAVKFPSLIGRSLLVIGGFVLASAVQWKSPPVTKASAAVDVPRNKTSPVLRNVTLSLKKEQVALKGLLAHLKEEITDTNKQESKGKSENQQLISNLKLRLDRDRVKLNDTNLSKFEHDLTLNRTLSEERELKYWSRGRELQHRMFHANLAMKHGMMSKVKSVMQAYDELLSKGKISPEVQQKMRRAAVGLGKPSS